MMMGLVLVEEAGEIGGVEMRSMAAVKADTGGVHGGTRWDRTEDTHLLMAPSCAQCFQWLEMDVLRRQ